MSKSMIAKTGKEGMKYRFRIKNHDDIIRQIENIIRNEYRIYRIVLDKWEKENTNKNIDAVIKAKRELMKDLWAFIKIKGAENIDAEKTRMLTLKHIFGNGKTPIRNYETEQTTE